jgi:putative endonuclease
MSWFVYAIKSIQRNYIYVGLTSDLKRRITQHNTGKERTTRPYRPFELIYIEIFETRSEARNKEIYLKSGCGKELLKSYSSKEIRQNKTK